MSLLFAGLRGAALLPLAVAAFLALRTLRASPESARPAALRWLRAGFLLLTLAWVAESLWLTVAWGEAWAWDPARNLGLLAWLVCAGALHLHHVPHLKGRKPARTGLAIGSLLALALCGLSLLAERVSPAPPEAASPSRTESRTSAPSGA
jgi:ABC-type transport system involved in cytochrome c biogenesis permease subunit